MKCNMCPRKCNIDRDKVAGFCGAKNLRVAKTMLHHWEEPIISGDKGSGAIFFSHCNLKCVYCQNWQISAKGQGKDITIEELIDIIKQLEQQGAHNINLVTPAHYTNEIIEALNIYKPAIPVVWNSSGYESVEEIKKLKDIVDVYLVDIKYMDNMLAKELSKAQDYPDVVKEAVQQMRLNQPKDVIKDNLMQKGVIVRHMVLPNEVENSFKVLDWVADNLGADTYISLMGQYTPCYLALDRERYNRTLKPIEYKRVVNRLEKLGFTKGFVQELSSANACFIPDFEGEK